MYTQIINLQWTLINLLYLRSNRKSSCSDGSRASYQLCVICRRTIFAPDFMSTFCCTRSTLDRRENSESTNCPVCRAAVVGNERCKLKKNSKTAPSDREIIVECSNRGGKWTSLAKNLGVNYQTVYFSFYGYDLDRQSTRREKMHDRRSFLVSKWIWF